MNPEIPPDSNTRVLRAMELISGLCDEELTPERARELESLVLGDPRILSVYVGMMSLDVALHDYASAFGRMPDTDHDLIESGSVDEAENHTGGNRMDETMVLPAMQDIESDIDEEFGEPYHPLPAPFGTAYPQKRRSLSPFVKGGIAAALLLCVGIFAHVIRSPKAEVAAINEPAKTVVIVPIAPVAPPPIPIATLNFTSRPVWEPTNMPPSDGNFVAAQTLVIESGAVQLSFHRGGRLVVEGPAEIKFVSDTKIELHHGKIVATIPGGGLVVDCPHGSVTDLGTQFGMDVNSEGATQVAVFQGSVSASLNSIATTQSSKDLKLTVGQAAVISKNVLTVDERGAVPQQFVRCLVNVDIKSLDVTDLICGGDGTTRRRGVGINANTGAVGKLPPVLDHAGDGKYHRISGYPVLDGGFIPNSAAGPVAVDSAGDKFDFAPAGGATYNYIFTGGKIPWPLATGLPTVLDGVDYSTADHSIIFLHANNALTLDLNAIRRLYPDRELTNFQCRVGNSFAPVPNPSASKPPISDATARVLVNGIVRAEKQHLTYHGGGTLIQVPLSQGDRFITLATTDEGTGILKDWIMWVDAKFDLSAGN